MEYKIISENWKKFINEAAPAQSQINNFGDLQKAIEQINRNKTTKAVAGQAGSFALDQIAGLIPGASNVKTAFDFFKSIYDAKDTQKTNTWLDKLNVDDHYSAIIDDTIENAFLKTLYNMISQQPPNKVLPPNYSIDAELENFLKTKYANRSVSGRTKRGT